MENISQFYQRAKVFNNELAEETRNKFLMKTLTSSNKTQIYNMAVKGDLQGLKQLIENDKYPMMEECSSAGYYWTAFHYAAHYGFTPIMIYILENYKYDKNKQKILNIQSNLGMTPLFIFLKNSFDKEKKKEILDLFVRYDAIDFSLCSKDGLDIFDFCKEADLLDYFTSSLRED